MTLPLIYALNTADKPTRNWILNTVKNHNKDKKKVKELIDYVRRAGGLEYAQNKMLEYRSEALKILESYPDNEYREALRRMIDFVVNREI